MKVKAVGILYSHKYFARCDAGHSRMVRAVSESNVERTRHIEHCLHCGRVPMTATAYVKPIAPLMDQILPNRGEKRGRKKKDDNVFIPHGNVRRRKHRPDTARC